MNEYQKWRQNETFSASLFINSIRHHQHYKKSHFFLPSSSSTSYLSKIHEGYDNIKKLTTNIVRNDTTTRNLIESIINKQIQNLQKDENYPNRIISNSSTITAAAALNGNYSAELNDIRSNENIDLEIDDKSFRESFIENSDTEFIQSGSLLFLIVIYGFVILCGVLGNASLVITLFSASSVRLRNPLLVALCIADLFVAGISAPTTIITLALTQKPSILSPTGCKVIYYLQSMPTAASTISFLMLSLDRFITVQHPTIAQIRQRRYVHAILAVISWLGASAICLPFILFYKLTLTSSIKHQQSSSSAIESITRNLNTNSNNNEIFNSIIKSHRNFSTSTISSLLSSIYDYEENSIPQSPQNYLLCQPDYDSNNFQTSFVILYTIIVYIFPGLGVLMNHYGVRRKLCALSLTARAAHGELPLPMPILRRPTHMIIVTGMANAARGVVSDDENGSDDDDEDDDNEINNEIINNDRNSMRENMVNILTPKTPRAMREIRAQQRRQKQEMKQQKLPAPGLPLPQTSTLRSRRRLANMLVAAAIIFVGCWTPHVLCILWSEFGHKQYCTVTMSYASLLLGYTHSAISPIIYWILNYNALRQSPCAPFMHLNTVQRFFRNHLRPTAPPPPSSTNEAALGAFNPRYIKATPKQYRAQASSHYLY